MKLTLKRIISGDQGTFGILCGPYGHPICCIVERPWLNNQEDVSCIPLGTYTAKREPPSDHFPYEKFRIYDVTGRDSILFHKGNTIADSKGCLLTVTGPDLLNPSPLAGKYSAEAFAAFMGVLKGVDSFTLEIVLV